MSYDLAVWEGEPPADAAAAVELFDELTDTLEADGPRRPTTRIIGFMDDVLERWPDENDERDEFPWAVAPVMPESASGGSVYLALSHHDLLDAMIADIGRLAREHGLQAYDPQAVALIS